ncbi:hypothetical protein J7M02_07545 [Candidatus Aerophobetes bacterium]|nr:hypothetical protein [Candidatus Aerophobetes bacterium]
MDIQYIMAILSGKLTAFFMKAFRRGGTALPGLVAETIDKNVLKKISPHFKRGIILITGTNGKTTTANILANILRQKGWSLLRNSAGSNLKRGIISTILKSINLKGEFKNKIDFGIFECDEAALIEIALSLNPQIILFNNLFRDQLDRYGEVETVRKKWINLIQNLKTDTKIILNADDPGVKSLGDYVQDKKNLFYFGLCSSINQEHLKDNTTYCITDFERCPICGKELVYDERYFSHLGNYFCKNCSFKKPSLDVCVKNIYCIPFFIFYIVRNTFKILAKNKLIKISYSFVFKP